MTTATMTPMQEQQRFCKKNDFPVFAFEVCPSCRRNIFEHQATREQAGKVLIIGCPFCFRSWCD